MLNFALLASPAATASVLHGLYDVFSSAGRDWNLLVNGVAGKSSIQPRLVASTTEAFYCANNVWIKPDASLHDAGQPDVIIIPEMVFVPGQPLLPAHALEYEWLDACYRRGTLLATACSGALLLAESGLLDGQEATTHWGLTDYLVENFPAIKVRDRLSLLVTGEDRRIIMAGGATSFLDLAVYLIARFLGVEEAMRVAKVWLIDWHDMGQQPYAALARSRQNEDRVIEQAQNWIAMNYDVASPVAAMVEMSGLAERSFKRRFSKATGLSPIEYVHTLRIEEAKLLLESTDRPVEALANEVGYEDTGFFGRLFKRMVGITPIQYRKRFGAMHKVLIENIPDQQVTG